MRHKIVVFITNIIYKLYTICYFILYKRMSNQLVFYRGDKQETANIWTIPKGVRIKMSGRNNIININLPIHFEMSEIIVQCNNSTINIGKNCRLTELKIFCGEGDSPSIKIGNHCTSTGEVKIISRGSPHIIIEDDCMFATNILIRLTDSHYIYDKDSNEIINKQKRPARIGRHTWIGQNVCLTKNISIPPNTIIGLGSVAGGAFTEEYTCIAGNPAKVVKKNVTWTRGLER